jgi:hypothetical protein
MGDRLPAAGWRRFAVVFPDVVTPQSRNGNPWGLPSLLCEGEDLNPHESNLASTSS